MKTPASMRRTRIDQSLWPGDLHQFIDNLLFIPELLPCIKDNLDPLIRGFQFELWALATRDAFAVKCRDRMTKVYCDFILKLVQPLAPDLPLREQRDKAAMVLALLQGFPLLVGAGVNIEFPIGNLEKRLNAELLEFIRTVRP
jgi:hypothetical protein